MKLLCHSHWAIHTLPSGVLTPDPAGWWPGPGPLTSSFRLMCSAQPPWPPSSSSTRGSSPSQGLLWCSLCLECPSQLLTGAACSGQSGASGFPAPLPPASYLISFLQLALFYFVVFNSLPFIFLLSPWKASSLVIVGLACVSHAASSEPRGME